MKKMRKVFYSLFIAIVVVTLFAFPSGVAFAEGEDPPSDNMFKPAIDLIKDMSIGILRFIVFFGGIVFIITVVMSATRGSLGTALGNQLQTSRAIIGALSGVAALIFMLIAIPMANTIINKVADKTAANLSEEDLLALTANIPEGNVEVGDVDLQTFLEVPALQGTIASFAISIIKALIAIGTIAFVVAVALGALDTQLATALGGTGLAGKGIMRVISAVAAVVFLFLSYPLAEMILRNLIPKVLNGVSIDLPVQ